MNESDSTLSPIEELEFSEAPPHSAHHSSTPLVRADAAFLADVKVKLDAQLGAAELSVSRLLALKAGDTVSLNERIGDLIELKLNSTVVARGELVAVGEMFGVRIVEISDPR